MFAYLDPFTGSMILQVIAAGFLGILAFFRPIWYLITGKKSKKTEGLDDWDQAGEAADEAADDAAQTAAQDAVSSDQVDSK